MGLIISIGGIYLLLNQPKGLNHSREISLAVISVGCFFIFNALSGKTPSQILNSDLRKYEINARRKSNSGNKERYPSEVTRNLMGLILLASMALGLIIYWIYPSIGFKNALIYPFGITPILYGIYSIYRRETLVSNVWLFNWMPFVWLRGIMAIISGVASILLGLWVLNYFGVFNQLYTFLR